MTAAIVLAAVLIIAAIYATWRACERPGRGGKHARLFADPADVTDPDGSVWLRTLQPDRTTLVQSPEVHHELSPFPAAGRLDMLPPDPPPADTAPLPVVICELGMPTDQYLDELFDKYAEVTA